jgi:large subunit ribosomal protein L13
MGKIIIDGKDLILGRLASRVAKMLISGDEVIVLNVEKIIVSGKKERVIKGYRLLFEVRTLRNPEKHGIRRPRNSVSIFKRTVRGMLPKNKSRKEMLSRLKVYVGIPDEFKNSNPVSLPEASKARLKSKYVMLEEISRELGGRV